MRGLYAFLVVAGLLLAGVSSGTTYEAPLPAQISTDPDLCAYVPCKDVLPAADGFSVRKGRPPYVEGWRGPEKKVVGYVFLSTDIVDIPAYSGKPVVTLIGMDTQGRITGVRILRHSEPILLLGIPEESLTKFVKQYVGKYVTDKIEVGRAREGYLGIDAISGATVTVIAENQVVLRSGLEIAKQVGIVKPVVRAQARFKPLTERLDWAALVKEGAVAHLRVDAADVGLAPGREPYLELWFGDLNAPVVGRSILGERGYAALMERLKPDEHAIFVIGRGLASFKGSGFVRGGIYDRIQVAQEMDTFTFRDLDYLNLYTVEAAGAPPYRESAIFIIRGPAFSAAYPWRLVVLANKVDRQTGARTFTTFDQEYWLPARYLEGGRPAYQRPDPTWLAIWKSRRLEIALFVLFLAAGGTTYALRERLVRRASRRDKRWVDIPKYLLWIVSVGFAGFYLMAQPSITQVLTWFHAIVFKWEWELFLSDPFIFLFWWFIIITVFFWGRGMFCGWMCPYGALSELAFKMAGALGLRRFQRKLPRPLHDRLKWGKYLVFAGLLAVSFYSMGLAEKLAEVEPFKTTFLVGVWNRSWPFVAFWLALLVAALFNERPFCKYLCPLGASLAVPSTFRWWGLKRKKECGPCDACAAGCGSLAIDASGRIDPRECLLCLDCMILYYDPHACPPLARERKARIKAGLALTPIGPDGYYIPLQPAAPSPPARAPESGGLAWVAQEAWDHLIPWSGRFLRQPKLFQAFSLAAAVGVTWVWLLGAAGKLGPGLVLGWWLAWSAYEVFVRMHCKPRVKEGPWWGRQYKAATWPDMISYVATKNLLIAVVLFLAMKSLGVLAWLQGLPELAWLY